jgi:hypothetical protein
MQHIYWLGFYRLQEIIVLTSLANLRKTEAQRYRTGLSNLAFG